MTGERKGSCNNNDNNDENNNKAREEITNTVQPYPLLCTVCVCVFSTVWLVWTSIRNVGASSLNSPGSLGEICVACALLFSAGGTQERGERRDTQNISPHQACFTWNCWSAGKGGGGAGQQTTTVNNQHSSFRKAACQVNYVGINNKYFATPGGWVELEVNINKQPIKTILQSLLSSNRESRSLQSWVQIVLPHSLPARIGCIFLFATFCLNQPPTAGSLQFSSEFLCKILESCRCSTDNW